MPETATVSVPMVDLKAQYARIREEIDAAVSRVVAGGQFIGGEECRLLEEEFARYCGAGHACGVANGTDALTLALKAFGVGPWARSHISRSMPSSIVGRCPAGTHQSTT